MANRTALDFVAREAIIERVCSDTCVRFDILRACVFVLTARLEVVPTLELE